MSGTDATAKPVEPSQHAPIYPSTAQIRRAPEPAGVPARQVGDRLVGETRRVPLDQGYDAKYYGTRQLAPVPVLDDGYGRVIAGDRYLHGYGYGLPLSASVIRSRHLMYDHPAVYPERVLAADYPYYGGRVASVTRVLPAAYPHERLIADRPYYAPRVAGGVIPYGLEHPYYTPRVASVTRVVPPAYPYALDYPYYAPRVASVTRVVPPAYPLAVDPYYAPRAVSVTRVIPPVAPVTRVASVTRVVPPIDAPYYGGGRVVTSVTRAYPGDYYGSRVVDPYADRYYGGYGGRYIDDGLYGGRYYGGGRVIRAL